MPVPDSKVNWLRDVQVGDLHIPLQGTPTAAGEVHIAMTYDPRAWLGGFKNAACATYLVPVAPGTGVAKLAGLGSVLLGPPKQVCFSQNLKLNTKVHDITLTNISPATQTIACALTSLDLAFEFHHLLQGLSNPLTGTTDFVPVVQVSGTQSWSILNSSGSTLLSSLPQNPALTRKYSGITHFEGNLVLRCTPSSCGQVTIAFGIVCNTQNDLSQSLPTNSAGAYLYSLTFQLTAAGGLGFAVVEPGAPGTLDTDGDVTYSLSPCGAIPPLTLRNTDAMCISSVDITNPALPNSPVIHVQPANLPLGSNANLDVDLSALLGPCPADTRLKITAGDGCQTLERYVTLQYQYQGFPAMADLLSNFTYTCQEGRVDFHPGALPGLTYTFSSNATGAVNHQVPPTTLSGAQSILVFGPGQGNGTFEVVCSLLVQYPCGQCSASVLYTQSFLGTIGTDAPTVADAVVCQPGGSASLHAVGPGSISWYSSPVGGSPLATGGTFSTPPLHTTTRYYVQAVQPLTGCVSPMEEVLVRVATAPALEANPIVACPGGNTAPVHVRVTNPVAGATYAWSYRLGTGNPLPIAGNGPEIDAPMMGAAWYYAEQGLPGCTLTKTGSVHVAGLRDAVLVENHGVTVQSGAACTLHVHNPQSLPQSSAWQVVYEWETAASNSGQGTSPISGASAATYSFTASQTAFYRVRAVLLDGSGNQQCATAWTPYARVKVN